MGKAERRKGATLELRIANARQQVADATVAIQARQNLILEQEVLAVSAMVWWQLDMSIERYEMFERAAHRRNMKVVELTALMSMFGVYSFINPRRMR
jgi:hypothetical protein